MSWFQRYVNSAALKVASVDTKIQRMGITDPSMIFFVRKYDNILIVKKMLAIPSISEKVMDTLEFLMEYSHEHYLDTPNP